MGIPIKAVFPVIAVGGGAVSLVAGVYSLWTSDASMRESIAMALLLFLATSLAVALGIQGLTYRRASRYATAMPDILLLIERIWRNNPETLTGAQATEICDRAVDALAKVFCRITGAPCVVSIEILTPMQEGDAGPARLASDYLVVNLSRDSFANGSVHDRRRHAVDSNTAYREVFHDPDCGAAFFRDDVAADDDYFSSELEADEERSRLSPWPLHYRSTAVVKICEADLCRANREHAPIAFLWLRSLEPGVFEESVDVELMRRMSRALAPIVTRCVRATKPSHDFRRQQAAVP